ncbi:hypothetical protein [Streptomyces sp. NPDC059015]|uniref:hypothetical protein n=1 Tax=unclassified Streptomyces TaxID=2593676 RepID=UPI0036C94CCC
MAERLDPDYETEIRDRIDRLDDDRVLTGSAWLASTVGPKSVFPPEQSHVVEDLLETEHASIRGSVGVFASKQYAEFTAHARDDIPALLDEIDRLRANAADELLPVWEAVYEPGNVSDYLIGYANSEAAAKGAAIAWLQSESDKDPARLEWVPEPAGDRHDVWFDLIENHDDGIHTGIGITVRRRLASSPSLAAGDKQPETEALCRCGHGKHRHVDPPGTPICMDCPGDEERSWRHPYTPASKGGA